MRKRKITLLGSTGSIGKQTLSVIDDNKDQFEVVGLAVHSSLEVIEQYDRYKPRALVVFDKDAAEKVKSERPQAKVLSGSEGLLALIDEPTDLVVAAMTGMKSLFPVAKALSYKIPLAIANKELLVSAGDWLTKQAQKLNVPLLPIDSEHNALFQLLEGQSQKKVKNVYLTASGGPFRDHTVEQLKYVSLEQALRHPTWSMGAKNTIDSSTLMNKGLEVIEAKWLFGLHPDQIKVVVHPQSIIHAMVEWIDGSFFMHASAPSMKAPIQHCLLYPERKPGNFSTLDLSQILRLDLSPPDLSRFKCLRLAYDALKIGKSMSCFMNAVNEECVSLFLQKRIGWTQIGDTIEDLMEKYQPIELSSVEEVMQQDQWARKCLREHMQ